MNIIYRLTCLLLIMVALNDSDIISLTFTEDKTSQLLSASTDKPVYLEEHELYLRSQQLLKRKTKIWRKPELSGQEEGFEKFASDQIYVFQPSIMCVITHFYISLIVQNDCGRKKTFRCSPIISPQKK